MGKTHENPDYDYCKYRAYEAVEKRARNDKALLKEIAKGDFYEIADKQPELIEAQKKNIKFKKLKIIKNQTQAKRMVLNLEEELKMDRSAFENGIVKIKIDDDQALNMKEYKEFAEKHAGGLPTKEELVSAGVYQGWCTNFWQPVLNSDKEIDLCQLGSQKLSDKQYSLYTEATTKSKVAPVLWHLEKIDDSYVIRAGEDGLHVRLHKEDVDRHKLFIGKAEEGQEPFKWVFQKQDGGDKVDPMSGDLTDLHIKAACSNRAWDVPCQWDDGKRLHAWECHGGHNQKMNIEWVDKEHFRVWTENDGTKWYLNYHTEDLPESLLRMTCDGVNWGNLNNKEPNCEKPVSWMYAKRCPNKNPEFVNILNKDEEDQLVDEKSKSEMKDTVNRMAVRQLTKRREHFDYKTEVEMSKTAFVDHNLVRINVEQILTWGEAATIAHKLAGGLPTRQELIDSKVNEGQGVDFWMYVQRGDGKPDVVQIGNHPHIKERYISHLDSYGPAGWLNNHHSDTWRPSDYIYARRCPVKNSEFVPPMTDEDKKKLIPADSKK